MKQQSLILPLFARASTEAALPDKFEAKERGWARRPDLIKNHHRIFLGDARELRDFSRDAPIHLVVTSPPYWDLKQYHHDRVAHSLGTSRTAGYSWPISPRSGNSASTDSYQGEECALWLVTYAALERFTEGT